MSQPLAGPSDSTPSVRAQIALMALLNGLALGWALYTGWTLFSVFLFYWMETVALLIGFLVAAGLGTVRLDGRRALRWRQRLIVVLILAVTQGLAAGFFLFFIVGFIGGLTYGSLEPAIAAALALVPLQIGLIAVYGLLIPAVDRLHMALGSRRRLIGAFPAGRFVRLHLGLFLIGLIAVAVPVASMTALVVVIMLLKILAEAWMIRYG